jgi:hypothetical protein
MDVGDPSEGKEHTLDLSLSRRSLDSFPVNHTGHATKKGERELREESEDSVSGGFKARLLLISRAMVLVERKAEDTYPPFAKPTNLSLRCIRYYDTYITYS